jgi:hypothetical protein
MCRVYPHSSPDLSKRCTTNAAVHPILWHGTTPPIAQQKRGAASSPSFYKSVFVPAQVTHPCTEFVLPTIHQCTDASVDMCTRHVCGTAVRMIHPTMRGIENSFGNSNGNEPNLL